MQIILAYILGSIRTNFSNSSRYHCRTCDRGGGYTTSSQMLRRQVLCLIPFLKSTLITSSGSVAKKYELDTMS